ncbi:MAG: hypothetical protein FVQ82_12970 [Planctomycetes bacterium]|nr:hypothetical protein [Planctomycetota bacterium]
MSNFKTKFVTEERTAKARKMIDELNGVEVTLSVSQINFIDSVYYWRGNFTERQAEGIEGIYEKVASISGISVKQPRSVFEKAHRLYDSQVDRAGGTSVMEVKSCNELLEMAKDLHDRQVECIFTGAPNILSDDQWDFISDLILDGDQACCTPYEERKIRGLCEQVDEDAEYMEIYQNV